MNLKSISLSIILLFAIIGIIFSSIVLHELYHVYDFNKENFIPTNICLLNIEPLNENASLGYVDYNFKGVDVVDYERVNKYSEVKAYIVTSLVLIIGTIALFYYSSKVFLEDSIDIKAVQ